MFEAKFCFYSVKQFFKLNDPKIVDKKFGEEKKKKRKIKIETKIMLACVFHAYAVCCTVLCAPLIKFVMKVLINIS